jgi:hypothetical protein
MSPSTVTDPGVSPSKDIIASSGAKLSREEPMMRENSPVRKRYGIGKGSGSRFTLRRLCRFGRLFRFLRGFRFARFIRHLGFRRHFRLARRLRLFRFRRHFRLLRLCRKIFFALFDLFRIPKIPL